MPIVSSVIVEDAAQKDTRRAITEAHTDQVGIVHLVKYIAAAAADVNAALAIARNNEGRRNAEGLFPASPSPSPSTTA